ncbi:hypothetical protein PSHT_13368 [Puccinia striiformis]|uniref:C2H2-type domain-containing protein n=1 Tax=Puccinia striiformis TaxID=27350 RepID=A0A2S4UR62_9BASI|nr:hypothetical protein PSHT_13368 [Puccinia striiformis]
MLDQWKPALDFMDGSLTHYSPYPQADQDTSQYSMNTFLDYNPEMLSTLLLPMPSLKPHNVNSITINANINHFGGVGYPASTPDAVFHQPINHSFQRLERVDCLSYSPASSPNGSCSDLAGPSKHFFAYPSPSNADNLEVVSDVGCSTPTHSTQSSILPDSYSDSSDKHCLNRPQAALLIHELPTNPKVSHFGGPQSTVMPYPNAVFPVTGTARVASPVSLMAKNYPSEPSGNPGEHKWYADGFSRTWRNDCGDFNHATDNFNSPQPMALHSRCDDSNQRHDPSGNVPIVRIKRFPCPECGQRFARAFNLQTHIATHAGMRPFSCPADGCSKAFSRRHDLGRHVGAVHREWLALKNISVEEAVKPLRWKTGRSKSQNRRGGCHQANKTLITGETKMFQFSSRLPGRSSILPPLLGTS